MRTIAIATLTGVCAASLAVASFERGHDAIDEAVRALRADSIKTLQFRAETGCANDRAFPRSAPRYAARCRRAAPRTEPSAQ
jgi:hypothetical protein